MGWPIPEEFWFHGKLKEHFIRTLINSRFLPHCGIDLSGLDEKDIFHKYSFGLLSRFYVLETWHSVFWGDAQIQSSNVTRWRSKFSSLETSTEGTLPTAYTEQSVATLNP